MADTRLKIAVFIDFDNIEIGVKSTLNTQFDIGLVLEALKERGDVVSKIAYGDWTRAGDYSRSLTQHATKLVQRNLTPGGDKNGADINLALDALEMAFTHPHINAYVIVGGDSDFITLVEKLKQYDKQIFVVGGRAFTSFVMQRNCHEFIAYENLLGSRRSSSDRGGRQGGSVTQAPIEQVVPLMRRALKVLTDREVSPQLGLLKSTLLQLDSTFSERTYGVSSFRDFAQKLAAAGYVTVKESGRNVLVELAENPPTSPAQDDVKAEQKEPREDPQEPRPGREERQPREDRRPRGGQREGQPAPDAAGAAAPRTADGIREVRRLFQGAQNPPRWPMYIRQAKQFMRNVDATFDERKFGFSSLVDLLRACQRDGLFRMERDRQGVIRLFPGTVMQGGVEGAVASEQPAGIAAPRAPRPWQPGDDIPDIHEADRPDPPMADVVEGDVVQEMETPLVIDAEPEPQEEAAPVSKGRGRAPRARSAAAPKAPREAKAPRAKKAPGTAKARTPRAKKSTE
ncbi:MAG TPA: NYN domain-containing protein [Vicinamibacterales bacterium]|nr:NYN domain-containing protein [Vicinamibacterales bacterium]